MAIEVLSPTKQSPMIFPGRTAASVPTPAAGTVTLFQEAGALKQKDSSGTVIDLTETGSGGGSGLTHGQVMRRLELLG